MKLTRKQIKEGLEAIPVDRLLLGGAADGIGLTKKQKAFADEVVRSGNKTAAYRKAYNTKGKPQTASRDAQKIANNPKVSTYIQALEAAEAAKAYLVPARLRDLAIHKITEKALDPEVPPAQQLKALELLGKITEVSLFTHRTETVHLTSSQDIKQQLIKSLRLALSGNNVLDVEAKPVDDLLAEIAAGRSDSASKPSQQATILQHDAALDDADPPDPIDIVETETLPTPTPQKSAQPYPPHLHSIPHNQSEQKSEGVTPVTPSSGKPYVGVTPVTPDQGKPLVGEGE